MTNFFCPLSPRGLKSSARPATLSELTMATLTVGFFINRLPVTHTKSFFFTTLGESKVSSLLWQGKKKVPEILWRQQLTRQEEERFLHFPTDWIIDTSLPGPV